MGLFVERLVIVTVSGEQPDSLLAVKSATGAWENDVVEIVNRQISIAVKYGLSNLTLNCNKLESKLI